MTPGNKAAGSGCTPCRPAQSEIAYELNLTAPPKGSALGSRRHGPFPDRSLRAFAGWPEGLEVFLSVGSPASAGRRP